MYYTPLWCVAWRASRLFRRLLSFLRHVERQRRIVASSRRGVVTHPFSQGKFPLFYHIWAYPQPVVAHLGFPLREMSYHPYIWVLQVQLSLEALQPAIFMLSN